MEFVSIFNINALYQGVISLLIQIHQTTPALFSEKVKGYSVSDG